jgi:hypothetical protein
VQFSPNSLPIRVKILTILLEPEELADPRQASGDSARRNHPAIRGSAAL